MHDKTPAMPHMARPGMEEDGGSKGHVELHHGPNPDDGKGKFHTIHQPSGEKKGHETLHDAHHAMNEHMGEDGCKGAGCAEHGEPDGDEGQQSGAVGDEAY